MDAAMANASVRPELEPINIPLPLKPDFLRTNMPSPKSLSDLSAKTIGSSRGHSAEFSSAAADMASAASKHSVKEGRQEPKLKKPKTRQPANDKSSRWWTYSKQLVCPITNFPINLLPYPPFKLRVDPQKASPYILLDGKILAMELFVHGHCSGVRELQDSDIICLNNYIQRCKLGLVKPDFARALAKKAAAASSSADCVQCSEQFQKLQASTRAQLGKLKRIQENRLLQFQKLQEQDSEERHYLSEAQHGNKPPPVFQPPKDEPPQGQVKSPYSLVQFPLGEMLSF
eukprot:TRINITY_DN102386_c0_g1_i1.p1 TRINITY_DN102386_c0_g1~~TRINITY_DN102386_c0_g1_i1.p1  ORF type:complete len:287 (+),score=56.41 TRINITY_DN102386_c0_g1_i1:27-887(+)